jgi:hypothetical protein
MSRALVWSVLVAAIALPGCKKRDPSEVRLKHVNDAFVKAGFKLDTFQPADRSSFGASACAAGAIDGIDTLVCELPGDPTPPAKKAAEDWIGQAVTGSVLTRGHTLLAVADRRRVDPNGKTIHKITQTFQKVE